MARHDVHLVCRRFDVLVTYQPFDGLSPIEAHMLLAMTAGVSTIDDLRALLKLPRRLLLDACIDLLAIGAIEIAGDGALAASQRVREAIGDWRNPTAGWEGTFATSITPPPETVPLMQDTVSGSIFRALPWKPVLRGGLHRLPQDPDLLPLETVPRPELLTAVLARPLRPHPQTSAEGDTDLRPKRARIGEVRLRRQELANQAAQPLLDATVQLVEVELAGVVLEDGGSPRFSVLGPDTLPSVVRSRIGSSLARLWDRGVGRGKHQIFDVLRFTGGDNGGADVVHADLPSEALARFEAAVAAKSTEPNGEAHEELLAAERDASAAIARAVNAGAKVALVTGAAAHHDALFEALTTAKQQVVLACPWVTRLEVPKVRTAIADAVARGVVVFLLWGIARGEPIPDSLVSLRAELAPNDAGGALLAPDRSTVSHAKLIVCDHHWGIVTSSNFLSSGPERTTAELGVRLTSPPRTSTLGRTTRVPRRATPSPNCCGGRARRPQTTVSATGFSIRRCSSDSRSKAVG